MWERLPSRDYRGLETAPTLFVGVSFMKPEKEGRDKTRPTIKNVTFMVSFLGVNHVLGFPRNFRKLFDFCPFLDIVIYY